jgi:hypothetical protein
LENYQASTTVLEIRIFLSFVLYLDKKTHLFPKKAQYAHKRFRMLGAIEVRFPLDMLTRLQLSDLDTHPFTGNDNGWRFSNGLR